MARTPLRAALLYGVGEFEEAMKVKHLPIAKAATAAIREAGEEVKRAGRANIAAAGFSTRWQNALRVDIYPKGKTYSINAAAWVYHKIPYAGVFETGATIRGKPKMWIALPNAPKKIGTQRMTPGRLAASGVKLFPLIGPRGNTVLAAKMSMPGKSKLTDKGRKFTVSQLKARKVGNAKKNRVTVAVPLFVGLDTVTIKKRLNIAKVVETAANGLAAAYVKHLQDE